MYKKPKSTMRTVGACISLLGVLSAIVCSCVEVAYRFQNPDMTDFRAMINCPEIYIALAVSVIVIIAGSIIFHNN